MENEKVSAVLPLEILTSIFRILNTDSKGKAAQVCTSWKTAADYKMVWKGVKAILRSENLNVQSEQNIIKRGIKRFSVWVFEPRINEFLRTAPDIEYLRFVGCCAKQKIRNFFDTITNSDAFMRLGVEDNLTFWLRDFDNLKSIALAFDDYHNLNESRCRFNDGLVLETFTMGMTVLKELYLEGCHFEENETDLFAEGDTINEKLPSLQKLTLRRFCPVNEKTIDYICQKFVNLVSLNIEGSEIDSSKGFVHLPRLQKLESLSFLNSGCLTDDPLENISYLSNLKFLDLGDCFEITDDGFKFICRLKNLVSFKAENLCVTDAAFSHINQMVLLRELTLTFSTISDAGLLHLRNLNLTKLDISCGNFTDEGLLNICQSTFPLHYLDASCTYITDYGVKRIIKKFSYLQVLHIDYCHFVNDTTRQFISVNLRPNQNLNTDDIRQDSNRILSTELLDFCLELSLANVDV